MFSILFPFFIFSVCPCFFVSFFSFKKVVSFFFFFKDKISMLGFVTLGMVKGGITRDAFTQKVAATGFLPGNTLNSLQPSTDLGLSISLVAGTVYLPYALHCCLRNLCHKCFLFCYGGSSSLSFLHLRASGHPLRKLLVSWRCHLFLIKSQWHVVLYPICH